MAKKKKTTKKKKPKAVKKPGRSTVRKTKRTTRAKPRQIPARITSIRQLAKQYSAKYESMTHTAVGKWVKHGDWIFGNGPWDYEELQLIHEWRLQNLAVPNESGQPNGQNIEDMNAMAQAKLALLIERTLMARFKRQVLEGEHIELHEVHKRETKFALWYRSVLLRMPRDIRSKLGPKFNSDQAELIERRIETYIRNTLLKMAGHDG